MDPLDHVRASLDGTTCAVCDGSVPSGATQVLAHRDGLAVLHVDCPHCGSTSLAFIGGTSGPSARGTSGDPVTADDVLDMHEFLHGWQGGLAALVAHPTGSDMR